MTSDFNTNEELPDPSSINRLFGGMYKARAAAGIAQPSVVGPGGWRRVNK